MAVARASMQRRGDVFLAIDDGPSDATPELLRALEAGGHRAVLFTLGCNVAGREAMLEDALRRGFALGNHSFTHPRFSEINLDAAADEIRRTEIVLEALHRTAGVTRLARWFRFPFLDAGEAQGSALQQLLHAAGMRVPRAVRVREPATGESHRGRLDWPSTLITRDWALPPEAELRAVLARARRGDVIELHDNPDTVPRITGPVCEELARSRLRGVVPIR